MQENEVKVAESKGVRIAHLFAPEIFLPWAAISNNIEIVLLKGKTVVAADFEECTVVGQKTLHVFSEEAVALINRLYGIRPCDFLLAWYRKFPDMMSLEFVYLKLEKKNI